MTYLSDLWQFIANCGAAGNSSSSQDFLRLFCTWIVILFSMLFGTYTFQNISDFEKKSKYVEISEISTLFSWAEMVANLNNLEKLGISQNISEKCSQN